MNRVVGLNQVDGFQVKIKTVQSGNQLISMTVNKNPNQENEIQFIIPKKASNYDAEYNNAITEYQNQITIINEKYLNGDYETEEAYKSDLNDVKKEHQEKLAALSESGKNYDKFKVGQYYKIQIAYINDGTVGYYSSVAVAKYTTKPIVTINHLDEKMLNSHIYSYTGIYKQDFENADKSERVYSYRFDLYDQNDKIIRTSGELLHNSENDELASSEDSYSFSEDLPLGQTYSIKYTVITNNGMESSSPRYRVIQKPSINPEIQASLLAKLNYDNGYIDISLKAFEQADLATGFFMIVRSCEDSNFTKWEEVHKFSLTAQIPTKHLYRDFTVEQGKKYRYGLQQYNNNNLYSNRILSNTLLADFEDAFLFDGKRQLKIKYNPKVSSFKKDLLETKTDTIGGKHPFIFRNGRVYYSEFSISGLISYQMDEENLFLSEEEYGLTEKTVNLTGENIAAEREFKMKVLEWLTNGEPKVFRSPAEGNFIVRLMNSSLSPNDTVGRMLHTFTSTAYEVADFNYETLGKMGFITIDNQTITALQWETVEFMPRNIDSGIISPVLANSELLKYSATTVRFDNMVPGDIVKIVFSDNVVEEIKMGITGSYYIDTGVAIKSIQLTQSPKQGSMTYSYYYTKEPMFNSISDVNVIEVPQHQFIGEHNILQELLYVYDQNLINEDKSVGGWIKNPKLELHKIYSINIEKRPLQRLEYKNQEEQLLDPFLIYELGSYSDGIGFQPGRPNKIFTLEKYYDGFNKVDCGQEYQPLVQFNDEVVNVNEKEQAHYLNPENITKLKSGNGVLVNLAYSISIIAFKLEDDARKAYQNNNTNHYLYRLGQAISVYDEAMSNMQALLSNENSIEIEGEKGKQYIESLNNARSIVKTAYDTYILELVAGQEEDARRKGEIE